VVCSTAPADIITVIQYSITRYMEPAHQQTSYTDQPRLNNHCYAGVWAVVADCGPGRAGLQNGLEIVGRAGRKFSAHAHLYLESYLWADCLYTVISSRPNAQ